MSRNSSALSFRRESCYPGLINSREIELTSFGKSPLPPLFQRGVIPPFDKGRSGGIIKKGVVIIMRPLIMAGWDSHISGDLRAREAVGLGLNENELRKNKVLPEAVIHDLNKDPYLPFPDNRFDVVVNTVSVDYMTKPAEVFKEVGRVLKPGGLFLVIFSNRMFPEKAVKVWREAGEEERVLLVEDFFKEAGL